MKATINETGCLTIIAESGLESYALNKWLRDWQEKQATLNIEVFHPTTSGAHTFKNVDA